MALGKDGYDPYTASHLMSATQAELAASGLGGSDPVPAIPGKIGQKK